jgi:hypothetical protein
MKQHRPGDAIATVEAINEENALHDPNRPIIYGRCNCGWLWLGDEGLVWMAQAQTADGASCPGCWQHYRFQFMDP